MTTPIQRLTSGDTPSGIYRLDMSMRPEAICRRIIESGLNCCYIDGSKVADKTSLLDAVGRSMSFPDYYGHNWDALEECITDLTWLDGNGCVLLYDHPAALVAHHPDDWKTFYDILQSAVEDWTKRSRPFYVLLRNAGAIPQAVPWL